MNDKQSIEDVNDAGTEAFYEVLDTDWQLKERSDDNGGGFYAIFAEGEEAFETAAGIVDGSLEVQVKRPSRSVRVPLSVVRQLLEKEA